jgi:hypothetical protein
LAAFGAPLDALSEGELASEDLIFQIGVAPIRIDVITSIDGVAFADAWERRREDHLGATRIAVIGREDLIANKRVAGRPRDLADVKRLLDDR